MVEDLPLGPQIVASLATPEGGDTSEPVDVAQGLVIVDVQVATDIGEASESVEADEVGVFAIAITDAQATPIRY